MTQVVIERHPDWHARLELFVSSMARAKFEPGINDCGLFAATGVQVQDKHDRDFAAAFRGRYSTLEEGLKLLHAAGFADQVELAAASLFECPPSMARLGDVAAVDFGDAGMTLMIVGGQHLVGPMPGMRGSLPRTHAVRAFAVGWQP